jgi:1-phosphatidylinositol-3-phosphate 5-kinase
MLSSWRMYEMHLALFLKAGCDTGYDSSSLLSPMHPEMSVNGKITLKDKYSITVVYDNRFFALRKKCCLSELAYITSLSRCKKWNAQGGKSKAYFAKTTDDRFIIKQIKKTEFESFIKFAPDYFKHVYHSLDTGSQTCLAKILGIYQVIISRARVGFVSFYCFLSHVD